MRLRGHGRRLRRDGGCQNQGESGHDATVPRRRDDRRLLLGTARRRPALYRHGAPAGRPLRRSSMTRALITTAYRPRARSAGDQPTNYARTLLILPRTILSWPWPRPGPRSGDVDEAAAAGVDALACGRVVRPRVRQARHRPDRRHPRPYPRAHPRARRGSGHGRPRRRRRGTRRAPLKEGQTATKSNVTPVPNGTRTDHPAGNPRERRGMRRMSLDRGGSVPWET
jgi:hypothetical protein